MQRSGGESSAETWINQKWSNRDPKFDQPDTIRFTDDSIVQANRYEGRLSKSVLAAIRVPRPAAERVSALFRESSDFPITQLKISRWEGRFSGRILSRIAEREIARR
jgi:hypothetical protein